jgi:hypothetical protein
MVDDLRDRRRVAWLLILIADVGLLRWGAMAALAPEHLLGPASAPILTAGYEGFTKRPWSELADTSREFITRSAARVFPSDCRAGFRGTNDVAAAAANTTSTSRAGTLSDARTIHRTA